MQAKNKGVTFFLIIISNFSKQNTKELRIMPPLLAVVQIRCESVALLSDGRIFDQITQNRPKYLLAGKNR
jgi:hypothetical protein